MGKHSQKILYRKYLFSIKEKERDKSYGQSKLQSKLQEAQ